jgi:hypothetical protein
MRKLTHGSEGNVIGYIGRKLNMGALATRLVVLAAVLATAACSDETEPAFQVTGTGSVEGLVFFDADKNGSYDPSAGDTLLKNVSVSLRERGTQQTLANGTGQTNASGRFVLTGVAPGSHSLVIDTATAGGVRFCSNPVPVDVFISESQFVNVGGRVACIITIAAAEQLRNQTVVVQGIITSSPDQLQPSYTYIQDETGGIRVFSSALAGKGLAIGDRVEVTGVVSDFSADLQIGGTVILGTIQKNVGVVVPTVLTTGALAASSGNASAENLGILVELKKVKFTTTFGAGGINGRNAYIDDGSGRIQIRFAVNVFPAASTAEAQAALNTQYPVGAKCYDITGVTGAFNTDIQVFPRTLTDIKEVPCS